MAYLENGGMTINPLTKEVVSIFFLSFKQLSMQIKDDYWTLQHYELDLPEKWNLSHVILDSNTVKGFVIASVKGNAIHINRLVVAENAHGKGLGKRLIRLLIDKCAGYSLNQITLKVNIDNFDSINWYFNQGFRIVARLADYFEMKMLIDDHRNTSA